MFEIIHEDDAIVAVNKPAGVLSHSDQSEYSVSDFVSDRYDFPLPTLWGPKQYGLVHRLDRFTSGVLLCAKTTEDQRYLITNWRRRVTKRYFAIVVGMPMMSFHEILRPIADDPFDPHFSMVSEEGRYAVTRWRLQERLADSYSLFEVEIDTGHMHQIRVHLSSDGFPIVGDKHYGFRVEPGPAPPPPRIMLHAFELVIPHPRTHNPLALIAPIPADFSRYLDLLRGLQRSPP